MLTWARTAAIDVVRGVRFWTYRQLSGGRKGKMVLTSWDPSGYHLTISPRGTVPAKTSKQTCQPQTRAGQGEAPTSKNLRREKAHDVWIKCTENPKATDCFD